MINIEEINNGWLLEFAEQNTKIAFTTEDDEKSKKSKEALQHLLYEILYHISNQSKHDEYKVNITVEKNDELE